MLMKKGCQRMVPVSNFVKQVADETIVKCSYSVLDIVLLFPDPLVFHTYRSSRPEVFCKSHRKTPVPESLF